MMRWLLYGIMDEKKQVVRPQTEWVDNTVDQCTASLQELSYSPQVDQMETKLLIIY